MAIPSGMNRRASLSCLAAVAFCFRANAFESRAAEGPSQEEAELKDAKENYKTQMQYQGQYADEVRDLKREYDREKARIQERYKAGNSSAPGALLLAADGPQGDRGAQERRALREAKGNYKTQMQYQGQYADEASDLKREYEREKARIQERYEAGNSSASGALLLAADSPQSGVNEQERRALGEAKENYKTQMQYQGQYADEAMDLKKEYDTEKSQIQKRYAAGNSSAAGDLLLAAEIPQRGVSAQKNQALREAKENYKIQMQYQGQYTDEARDLKREYEREKAQVQKQYTKANNSAAADLLLAAGSPERGVSEQEKKALREAKENYKTQMQYQGQYADEARDLKRQYETEKAKIQERYKTANASTTPGILQLAADDTEGGVSAQEKKALREAKENYKTQMQYQGQYADEAKDLKSEYEREKVQIDMRYHDADAQSSNASKSGTFLASQVTQLVATTNSSLEDAAIEAKKVAALEEELRALHKQYMHDEPMAEDQQGRVKAKYHERRAELEERLRKARATAAKNDSVVFVDGLATPGLTPPACSMLVMMGFVGAYVAASVLSIGRKRCARRQTGLQEGLLAH